MKITLNELFIKKTAINLIIDESIIEKVIGFKWKSIHEATSKYQSIEDSGLGHWEVRPNVLERKIKQFEGMLDAYNYILGNEEKLKSIKYNINARIEGVNEILEYLYSKRKKIEYNGE